MQNQLSVNWKEKNKGDKPAGTTPRGIFIAESQSSLSRRPLTTY